MNDTKKIYISIAIIVVIIGGAIAFATIHKNKPGKYDALATCIKDSGTIFYGAWWCPHCQATKKLFGTSSKLLPYVECSTADGKNQTPICIEKKIEGYPTWVFPDGSKQSGEMSIADIAARANCPIDGIVTEKNNTPVDAGATSKAN